MLVVRLELWPGGCQDRAKQLGEIRIANEGTGSEERGNYKFDVAHSGRYFGKPGPWKSGRIVGYERKRVSPYHLVLAVLERAFGIGAGTRACAASPERRAAKRLLDEMAEGNRDPLNKMGNLIGEGEAPRE